jgi:hypothetical protein
VVLVHRLLLDQARGQAAWKRSRQGFGVQDLAYVI